MSYRNKRPTTPTATLSAVASTATSTQLLGPNDRRMGVQIVNTDANALYIKYGTTASTTSFTVIIGASQYWEMPPESIFAGQIDGIWAADGSGSAYITEL